MQFMPGNAIATLFFIANCTSAFFELYVSHEDTVDSVHDALLPG
jgi:hypothetical protein